LVCSKKECRENPCFAELNTLRRRSFTFTDIERERQRQRDRERKERDRDTYTQRGTERKEGKEGGRRKRHATLSRARRGSHCRKTSRGSGDDTISLTAVSGADRVKTSS